MEVNYESMPQEQVGPHTTKKLERLLAKEELLIRSEFKKQQKANTQVKWTLVFSACLILVGSMGLMITGIFLLGAYLEWWKASFIMTLMFLTVGGFLYGMKKEKEIESDKYPKRSIDTINEMRNSLYENEGPSSFTQH